MAIRILHTADNHIGLPFHRYDADVRDRLSAERFEALARLVSEGNARDPHFLVIAGDLFDTTRVSVADIKRSVDVLKDFAGVAVLVLPGNHDHVAGPETEVWKRFRLASEGIDSIEVLAEPQVRSFEVDGQAVHFFPCPCPSKTGSAPMTPWVAEAAAAAAPGLRIGIAHGNVPGLGLDAADRYFTMDRDELESAGVATWLLGHIHVPFPTLASGERSPFFMAGTHTPDSIRCRHAGSAWWIECEGEAVVRYERLSTGGIRFLRLERELRDANDVQTLLAEIRGVEAGATVLDLQLSGRLTAEERQQLAVGLAEVRPSFLCLSEEAEIHAAIDAAEVAARYREGGLAQRLLTALLADEAHPEAAILAHELIEEVAR